MDSGLVVAVDFTKFPELHRRLAELAEGEDRTIEGQARWIIRRTLGELGEAG